MLISAWCGFTLTFFRGAAIYIVSLKDEVSGLFFPCETNLGIFFSSFSFFFLLLFPFYFPSFLLSTLPPFLCFFFFPCLFVFFYLCSIFHMQYMLNCFLKSLHCSINTYYIIFSFDSVILYRLIFQTVKKTKMFYKHICNSEKLK